MQISVEIKHVYGNLTIYPVCEKAFLFANLAGTKTLTKQSIAIIKQLGYEIIVKKNEVTL